MSDLAPINDINLQIFDEICDAKNEIDPAIANKPAAI